MTTRDLYRLARSFLKNGWRYEQVKDLFYKKGRIDPVPQHYEFIGEIERLWEKVGAITVQLTNGEIGIGDRIAFELPVEFEEQTIDSLQIDRQPVDRAGSGAVVGIHTYLSKEQAKSGVRVFKVKAV